ncbi:MAG: hypothetical protein U0165_09550 [Polyangiaceae bacterium]
MPSSSTFLRLFSTVSLVALVACASGNEAPNVDSGGSAGTGGSGGSSGSAGTGGSAGSSGSAGSAGVSGTSGSAGSAGSIAGSAGSAGSGGTGGACTSTSKTAEVKRLPVDIIWMVDNSGSMQTAIEAVQQGLNDFAAKIATSDVDYKVIMLSKRGTGVTSGGLYPICIPTPLASASCGNSTRFFHADFPNDGIKSTQLLEQFIGTLGQTAGFTPADARGSEPWKDQLRADATKTLVFVTDDNSRFTADQFLHFAGGQNPFNSTTLPPGILDASWNGLFDKWVAHGIYGWGSETDPSVTCTGGGITVAASGATYTDLIQMSDGARAKLCDGPTAWTSFFDTVATAVVDTAPIDCTIDIPAPPDGQTLDPGKVNVNITSDTGTNGQKLVGKTTGAGACTMGGWYYDNEANPTQITLCPSSCDELNTAMASPHTINVEFGCDTVVIIQ